jgi:hypothetical protein
MSGASSAAARYSLSQEERHYFRHHGLDTALRCLFRDAGLRPIGTTAEWLPFIADFIAPGALMPQFPR